MSHPTVISSNCLRARRAVAAIAVAFAAAAMMSSAPSAASAHTAGPACDRIAGQTLARDADWRIVEVSALPDRSKATADSDDRPVVACHRGSSAPAQERLLGTEPVDDAASNQLGFGVAQLVGSLAVVHASSGSSGGGSGDVWIDDLQTGFVHYAGPTSYGDNPELDAGAALSVGGGVSTLTSISTTPSLTDLRLFDAQGEHAGPAEIYDFAPSLGGDGQSPGVYLTTAAGLNQRLAVVGPAPSLAFSDPAAQPSSVEAKEASWANVFSPYHPDHLPAIAPLRGGTRTELCGGAQYGAAVRVDRRATHGRAAQLYVAVLPGGKRVNLAPGSAAAVRCVASASRAFLLQARFAAHPHQLRVRLVEAFPTGLRHIDIPAPPHVSEPGHALIEGSTVLIADGDQLLEWSSRGTAQPSISRIHAPGVHDLAASQLTSGSIIYYTEADGTVHTVPRP